MKPEIARHDKQHQKQFHLASGKNLYQILMFGIFVIAMTIIPSIFVGAIVNFGTTFDSTFIGELLDLAVGITLWFLIYFTIIKITKIKLIHKHNLHLVHEILLEKRTQYYLTISAIAFWSILVMASCKILAGKAEQLLGLENKLNFGAYLFLSLAISLKHMLFYISDQYGCEHTKDEQTGAH